MGLFDCCDHSHAEVVEVAEARQAAAQLGCHRHDEPCDKAEQLSCHHHDKPCEQAKQAATCEFLNEKGELVKVDFATRLAGMNLELKERSKVVVKKVQEGGQAEQLGVEVGWVLRSVGGAEVRDLSQGLQVLKGAFDKLPEASAPADRAAPTTRFVSGTLLFSDRSGKTHEATFKAEDPGFTVELKGGACLCVNVRAPKVVVKSVMLGGQADLAGVKVGWVLKAVGGVEVTDWEQVLRLLKDFFGHFTA